MNSSAGHRTPRRGEASSRRASVRLRGLPLRAVLAACVLSLLHGGLDSPASPILRGAAAQASRSGLDALANRCFYADTGAWAYTLCLREPGAGSAWQQAPGDADGEYFLVGRVRYPGYGTVLALAEGDTCPATGRPRGGSVLLRCRQPGPGEKNDTLSATSRPDDCSVDFTIASPAACGIPADGGPAPPAGESDKLAKFGVGSACIISAALVACVAVSVCKRLSRDDDRVRGAATPRAPPRHAPRPAYRLVEGDLTNTILSRRAAIRRKTMTRRRAIS